MAIRLLTGLLGRTTSATAVAAVGAGKRLVLKSQPSLLLSNSLFKVAQSTSIKSRSISSTSSLLGGFNRLIISQSHSGIACFNGGGRISATSGNTSTIIERMRNMMARGGQRRTVTYGREYQPNTLKRKRSFGFLKRLRTLGGRKILARRMKKGRKYLSH